MSDFTTELRAGIPRHLIEAVPGEPLSFTLPILDGGVPKVIPSSVGWSAIAQLRADVRAAEVLHTWTTAGGAPNIAILTGANGALTLTATAAETAAWQTAWPPAAAAVADVFVTDNTNTPRCLCDLVVSLLLRSTR